MTTSTDRSKTAPETAIEDVYDEYYEMSLEELFAEADDIEA